MIGSLFGSALAKAMLRRRKKKKLKEGMMKATGQSKEQAQKIKERTDIAASRLSAQRRAKGESPKYGERSNKETKSAMLQKRRILDNFKSKKSLKSRGK